MSKSAVSRMIKRYIEAGSNSSFARPGRLKRISQRTVNNMARIVNKNPFISSTKVSKGFSSEEVLETAP